MVCNYKDASRVASLATKCPSLHAVVRPPPSPPLPGLADTDRNFPSMQRIYWVPIPMRLTPGGAARAGGWSQVYTRYRVEAAHPSLSEASGSGESRLRVVSFDEVKRGGAGGGGWK